MQAYLITTGHGATYEVRAVCLHQPTAKHFRETLESAEQCPAEIHIVPLIPPEDIPEVRRLWAASIELREGEETASQFRIRPMHYVEQLGSPVHWPDGLSVTRVRDRNGAMLIHMTAPNEADVRAAALAVFEAWSQRHRRASPIEADACPAEKSDG